MDVLEYTGRILLWGFVLNRNLTSRVGTHRSADWLSTATRQGVRGLVQRISVRLVGPT
jgi:hypothetical protein